MKKFTFSLLCLLLVKFENAQSVNWASNIAPIFYNNCTKCHHTGGIAPFSLLDYNDAYQQRSNIKNDVNIKKMPPWSPDPSYTRLAHERLLTPAEISLITEWANNGAPMGDTTQAPVKPVYNNGSELGTPNLTLSIPAFTVPANQSTDIYQCFAIPTNLLTNQFITAMEIVPGNPAIVHHVLVYEDTSGVCAQLDSASPGPGYLNFGGVGTNKAILVGGWVPGASPSFLPANFGIKLFKNSYLVLQIHYPAGSNGRIDSTKINLLLANSVGRQVSMAPILNYLTDINAPLSIPADSIKTFNEHYQLPNVDISALSVAPHNHLVGQKWISYGITPANDTIPFIRINNWDFHWQGFYNFRNILKIPAKTTLWAYCTYNNTSNNPNNPNTPPITVNAGDFTTDEMMLVYFSYTIYQPGDENIALDTSALIDLNDTLVPTAVNEIAHSVVSTPQLYDAAPNPAKDETMITYYLPESEKVTLKIFDLQGRLVDEINATTIIGFNNIHYITSKLQAATYLISLTGSSGTRTKQLIVTR
jgi:Copper type II ascorbate-dependent monooxygenase, N-terminal domain/Secretion system C-terminal sorting domain/Copper type II ascorbate-dependent monooxygenase, C-terminal domain